MAERQKEGNGEGGKIAKLWTSSPPTCSLTSPLPRLFIFNKSRNSFAHVEMKFLPILITAVALVVITVKGESPTPCTHPSNILLRSPFQ